MAKCWRGRELRGAGGLQIPGGVSGRGRSVLEAPPTVPRGSWPSVVMPCLAVADMRSLVQLHFRDLLTGDELRGQVPTGGGRYGVRFSFFLRASHPGRGLEC